MTRKTVVFIETKDDVPVRSHVFDTLEEAIEHCDVHDLTGYFGKDVMDGILRKIAN